MVSTHKVFDGLLPFVCFKYNLDGKMHRSCNWISASHTEDIQIKKHYHKHRQSTLRLPFSHYPLWQWSPTPDFSQHSLILSNFQLLSANHHNALLLWYLNSFILQQVYEIQSYFFCEVVFWPACVHIKFRCVNIPNLFIKLLIVEVFYSLEFIWIKPPWIFSCMFLVTTDMHFCWAYN